MSASFLLLLYWFSFLSLSLSPPSPTSAWAVLSCGWLCIILLPLFSGIVAHSVIDLFTQSFIVSYVRFLVHSFISDWRIRSLTQSPTHSFIHSFTCSLTHTRCSVLRQVRVAVPTRHKLWRTSAQSAPNGFVAAWHLLLLQLHLQLLRLLRHGVTLPGHAVGTAGKEEEINIQRNCREQWNSSNWIMTGPSVWRWIHSWQ